MQRICFLNTLLISFFLSQTPSFCLAKSGCGEFEFNGYIRQQDQQIIFNVFENTMSQIQFTLSPELQKIAKTKVGLAVVVHGKLEIPIQNYRGHINIIQKDESDPSSRSHIAIRNPNPAFPEEDSGINLVNEKPCLTPN